jgi:hypothetical protein
VSLGPPGVPMGVKTALRRVLPHLALLLALGTIAAVGAGWIRYGALALAVVVAIHAIRRRATDVVIAALVLLTLLAAVAVTALRIDLGPAVRRLAEDAGSRYVHRPMHIGRLGVHLWSGRFVVEDLVIENLNPADQPFFTAKTIHVSLPWWRALTAREILIESVEMNDWRMLVEMYDDGRTNFLKFGSDRPAGPSRFRTLARMVHAGRGEFTYNDLGTWRTVASNLDVRVTNVGGEYRGTASSSNGIVAIKQYRPMRSDLWCTFKIQDGRVILDQLVMYAGASKTVGTGDVDFRHWPQQIYRVQSHVDFRSMKDVFFADSHFTAAGEGDFVGAFRLFKGGYELKGDFTSGLAKVNDFEFPGLRGSLLWEPHTFTVSPASARFFGGRVRFAYSYGPMSDPKPPVNRFDAWYDEIDLAAFTDFLQTKGLRLAGRATGDNRLEWPSGRWAEHRGEGHITATAPAGITLMTRAAPLAPPKEMPEPRDAWPEPDLRVVPRVTPIGGEIAYTFGPEWVDIAPGHVATETTYIAFDGRTAYGDRSRINFRVRSTDLQDADRLLAGSITAFGSPTGTINIGGGGQFDGVLVNAFRNPRIEGNFVGDRVRAWDVEWGHVRGSFAVENGYADVSSATLTRGDGQVLVDGRFSLGYPRKDGRDEIDARVRMTRWALKDLRHAFGLDDYPIDGTTSGEYHIYGRYTRPFGFGRMTVVDAVAYGEDLESAVLPLRFEGTGVRIDGMELVKGEGRLTGAAYIGWDGRYSFNVDARGVPLESINLFKYPQVPMTGRVEFSVSGASTFAHPMYELKGRIDDMGLKGAPIGQVRARLVVRDDIMSVELEAASARLTVSGAGQVARAKTADAELSLRFTDTALDPLLRVFRPDFSPQTSAVGTGSIHLVGQLGNPDQLLVEITLDDLDLRLFDYQLANAGPIRLVFDRQNLEVQQAELIGEGTRLKLTGTASIPDDRISIVASGEANLAALNLFFPAVRSAGRAQLTAEIHGSLSRPMLAGFATLANGRIRHPSLPHSIDAVNGRISFSNGAIRLDEVTGQIGGGPIVFTGLVGMSGYTPDRLALAATAKDLQLRYPAGFRSVVDADLTLAGTMAAPTLAGSLTVKSAVYRERLDLDITRLAYAAAVGSSSLAGAAPSASPLPLRFDLQVRAPSALRIESNSLNIVSSADLTLRGTLEQPLLFGRVEIEHGWLLLEGKRYVVTRATVDFSNPTRIEPILDFAAATRIRSPGQTYDIDVRVAGPPNRLGWQLSADPPLPELEILSLLLGDMPNVQDAELRALRNPNALRNELITSRLTQAAATPLTSGVNRAVEETFGLDTFQITPSLAQDAYQRLSANARLTFGKRISERVYLTFSRSLTSASRDQIILLEYDQSDRWSWILSQNEDNTYALEVRVRYVR